MQTRSSCDRHGSRVENLNEDVDMPTYSIVCKGCGKIEDRKLTFSEMDAFAEICSCGSSLEVGFMPCAVNFTLKDGPSGGWASRAIKEKQYREKRREILAKKEKDHVYTPSLVPNFNGEQTESWREARETARTVLGEASAKSYDNLVQNKG